MGGPILLGGGVFHLGPARLEALSVGVDIGRGRGSTVNSLAILAAVATGLCNRGYKLGVAKHGTPEDVRVSCDLPCGRIELLLVSDVMADGTAEFTLFACDLSRVSKRAMQSDAATEWKRISQALGEELAQRFGVQQIDWLGGPELGARLAAAHRL